LELQGGCQRAISTNHDKAVDLQVRHGLSRFLNGFGRNLRPLTRAHFDNEMAPTGCPKNCASLLHDAVGPCVIKNNILRRRQQAFKAIQESNHLPIKLFRSLSDSPEHRIQSWTIPAARQNTNSHMFHFGSLFIKRYYAIVQFSPNRGLSFIVQILAEL
jgi:hypothetical protein